MGEGGIVSIIYINPYQFAAAGVAYDTDAQAYITAVEAADGQALETGVRDAINAFVIGCKADGIWTAIKASCILAGARTLNGALVPLVPLVGPAPTRFGTEGGWNYNRKTGLQGNGTNNYLNSNRNNNADPQDNQHCSVYVSTAPTTGLSLIGAGQAGNGTTSIINGASRSRNATAVGFSAVTSGIVGISRNSSSSYVQRFNAGFATVTQSSQTPISTNFLLYARADTAGGGTIGAYANPRLAFYSIGESLDLALLDARVTTLINAFAAAIP
jgi:hypothetical protein